MNNFYWLNSSTTFIENVMFYCKSAKFLLDYSNSIAILLKNLLVE